MTVLLPFVRDGGILMAPILALSVLALTVVLERSFHWLVARWRRDEELREQLRLLHLDASRTRRTSDAVAFVLAAFLDEPQNLSGTEESARRLIRASKRGLGLLGLIATVSTSFGLLGTVVGVSASFSALATSNSQALASGLSVALNTTVAGLVIFLLSTIALTYFEQLSQKQAEYIEESLNLIQKRLTEEKAR